MRFDGLYAAPGDGYTAYLRFYPDGDVVSCSSTGTPAEVSRWFARGNQGAAAYVRDGDRVRFEFWIDFSDRGEPAPKGAIRYDGAFADADSLKVHVASDLTGSRTDETYRFVPATLV